MELMIEATSTITTIDGVPCRIWNGTTKGGVPCKVFVHRVAVHNQDDSAEFEAELQEQMPPAKPPIPLSHVLN